MGESSKNFVCSMRKDMLECKVTECMNIYRANWKNRIPAKDQNDGIRLH